MVFFSFSTSSIPDYRRFTLAARCCVVIASALLPVAIGGAKAETLKEAMTLAYENSDGLKAERSRYQATNEEVWKARSEFLPQVSGRYWMGHDHYRNDRTGRTSKGVRHEVGIVVSQPLFRGFSSTNRLKQSHALSAAGRGDLENAEQRLLLNTAVSYLRVVRDRAVLQHLKTYKWVVSQEVAVARLSYKLGNGTKTDIEQALARQAEAAGGEHQARGDLDASDAEYARYTGKKPGKLSWPGIPKKARPLDLEDAIAQALRNHPAIQAQAAGAEAAVFGAKAEAGAYLPDLSLEGSFSNSFDGNLGNRDEEDYRVGLRLNLPIFTGGYTSARVRQARFYAAEEHFVLNDLKTDVRRTVIQARRTADAARNRIVSSKRAIDANRRALKGLRVEYDIGQRTLLDILDGQRELANARITHEQARYDALVADFNLLASTGSLAPDVFDIAAGRPPAPRQLVPIVSGLKRDALL